MKPSSRWRTIAGIFIGLGVWIYVWNATQIRSLYLDVEVVLEPQFKGGRWYVDQVGRDEVKFTIVVCNNTSHSIATHQTLTTWDEVSYELIDAYGAKQQLQYPMYVRNVGGMPVPVLATSIPPFEKLSHFSVGFYGQHLQGNSPSGNYEIVAMFRHGERVYRSRPVPIEIVRR